MPFQAQPTEKCTACGKTVYLTEKTVVEEKTDKKIYHKQCIRCQTCNKVLAIGQYSSMDGQFWCKPHFKQLFATKGNYDEAFGKEKVTSKWDNAAAPTSPPSSFIPSENKSEAEKEKKPTSEATASKFRQFREQADADKCTSCGKTVYLAEKLLVEDKNDKKLFHKRCFTCATCNMMLDLRSYGSFGGKIYCKNHLKEQQSSARPTGGSSISAPTSFIPATEEKKTEKGQTPDNIASKFKGAETEKCKSCGKSVYATEKVTLPESFKQQSIYHKACLKCSICSCKLDVSNYGSSAGALFCQTHLKQYGKPEQAKGDYFVSPLANANPNYVAGPRDADASGYSDKEQDSQQSENQERNRDSDREEAEQRQQESDREERNETQRAAPERSSSFSSTGRESPAIEGHAGRDSPTIERADSDREQSSPSLERKFEKTSLDETSASASRERTSSRSEQVSGGDDDDFKRREAERARKREERQKAIEAEERQQEEERERRKRERERRLAESEGLDGGESTSSSSGGSESREAERERRRKEREEERRREEEDREKQEEKRKKEREDKRKEQEEEMKRELEDQEKKAEERRRKLAELKGNA